ncbi:MAG: Uma2 family endonuclease [Anaerolineae bacterium]|nr:Uma2 family endonuclease [Anaerolineae bacterium]
MAEAVVERQETATEPELLTVAEWMRLYNEHSIEVVNGETIITSPPNIAHVYVASDLGFLLEQHARRHQLGHTFIEAPYLLDASDRDDWVRGSRVPDVSFIAQARLDAYLNQHGKSGPFRLAPDLAVEIVSPNDPYSDVMQKVDEYLRYGVRLVWVIDPQTRTIRAFTPDDPAGQLFRDGDTLAGAEVLPGWSAAVTEVLGENGGDSTKL